MYGIRGAMTIYARSRALVDDYGYDALLHFAYNSRAIICMRDTAVLQLYITFCFVNNETTLERPSRTESVARSAKRSMRLIYYSVDGCETRGAPEASIGLYTAWFLAIIITTL